MWSTGGLQGAKVNTRVAPNSHVHPVARDKPRLAATRLQKGSPKRPTTTALPLFFLSSHYYPRICQGIQAHPLSLLPFVQELHNKTHCTDFLQPQPSSFRIRCFLSPPPSIIRSCTLRVAHTSRWQGLHGTTF